MLSCECDLGYANWYYTPSDDFKTLDTTRRKRCCSCKKLINIGSLSFKLHRHRDPNSDIEECIYGDSVPLAPWYLCEWCGEMYFTLNELGYCYWAGDDIREYLKEYWELTGFDPSKYQEYPNE